MPWISSIICLLEIILQLKRFPSDKLKREKGKEKKVKIWVAWPFKYLPLLFG